MLLFSKVNSMKGAAMCATATLFMHGREQALVLPAAFRFAGTQVKITKVGDQVILQPLASGALNASLSGSDCNDAARDDWREQLPMPSNGKVLE